MGEAELLFKRAIFTADRARVPALVTFLAGRAPGPTVLLLHGLGSNKEVQQKEASALARAGLWVITLDAPYHGERRAPLLDELMASTGAAANGIFLRMAREAIAEIPLVVDSLLLEGGGPIGIAGISMGAIVALGAASVDPRLAAIVSILGSPEWSPPSGEVADEARPWLNEEPARHPDRFPPRALLLANAGRDTNVPPHASRRFAEALAPLYSRWPDRFRYEEYAESSHFMREDDWDDLWSKTVGWLCTFLDPSRALPPS